MNDELKPYSVHSFMLPFRWDFLPAGFDVNRQGKEEIPFENRTDLHKFRELLMQGSRWKRKFFTINGKAENYNEIHYFHAYAANTMLDLQQVQEKDETMIHESKVMVYFELPVDPQTDRYYIHIEEEEGKKHDYTLHVSGISLHVYNTGVAILTLNVENYDCADKADVLYINEYGRRIYPQFLSHADLAPATIEVKQTFLADKIKLKIGGMSGLEDDFKEYDDIVKREVHHYEDDKYVRSWVVQAPKYIRGLFGDSFCFTQQEEEIKQHREKIRLNLLTDDRMFFQCWYGSNEVSEKLKIAKVENSVKQTLEGQYTADDGNKDIRANVITIEVKITHPYLTDNFWHAYLFGDKSSPTIDNIDMQRALTAKHTYGRWAGNGTLYGFTKDSFVCITDRSHFSLKFTRQHTKTMYYQMALLGIAQRSSVLRFSAEVSLLADMTKTGNDKQLIENVKLLYQSYIEFVNKVNYREITPYIQGMEMYCQFRQIMEVQDAVKGLDAELNELFNYIKLREDEKQGKEAERLADKADIQASEAHKLTKIAAVFLPPTFLASFFALFASDLRFSSSWNWPRIFAVAILIVFTIFPLFLYKHVSSFLNKFFSDKKDK